MARYPYAHGSARSESSTTTSMKRSREGSPVHSSGAAKKAARGGSAASDSSLNDVAAGGSGLRASSRPTRRCPYLDTINRQLLDFDKPKLCSVTMSTENVYVCLVDGIYFQGRGKGTPAWTHACQKGYHVFMKISGRGKGSIWCLPDNYEVVDESLSDIRFALEPTYSGGDISASGERQVLELQSARHIP